MEVWVLPCALLAAAFVLLFGLPGPREALFQGIEFDASASVALRGTYVVGVLDPEESPARLVDGVGEISDVQCSEEMCEGSIRFPAPRSAPPGRRPGAR